jgi:hypothetical protein
MPLLREPGGHNGPRPYANRKKTMARYWDDMGRFFEDTYRAVLSAFRRDALSVAIAAALPRFTARHGIASTHHRTHRT